MTPLSLLVGRTVHSIFLLCVDDNISSGALTSPWSQGQVQIKVESDCLIILRITLVYFDVGRSYLAHRTPMVLKLRI